MKNSISEEISNIEMIEYEYQLEVSRCIRNNKLNKIDLVKKVENLINIQEEKIKKDGKNI